MSSEESHHDLFITHLQRRDVRNALPREDTISQGECRADLNRAADIAI